MVASPPVDGATQRVLFWSPSLQGHRLVYCHVIAGALAELGREVVVAADLSSIGEADAPRLDVLTGGPVARLVDIGGDARDDRASLTAVRRRAVECGAQTVMLAEADDVLRDLVSWDARDGLPTRVLALFIRTTNQQYAPAPRELSAARRVLRRLRGAGGLDEGRLQRRLAAGPPRGVVPLVLDELYAARHAASHRWLPDIYRDPESVAETGERREWADRVGRFVTAAGARPLFVYIGTNQWRRGYDTLLRLAIDEGGCVAHCGRYEPEGGPQDPDVESMRATLAGEGRLLETQGPYLDPATADVFLRAARCVVLPYRRHDGSSGVMLQALAAGRPVLVPDRGLMGYRVHTFGLGATYRDGDEGDLRRRFREVHGRGPEPFVAPLAGFMRYFARPQLVAALANALTGAGEGALLPQPPAAAVTTGGGR